VAATAERLAKGTVDPEPAPEHVEHPGRAERAGIGRAQLAGRGLFKRADAVGALQVAADRAHQAPEPFDVELVLAAEIEEDLGLGHSAHAAVVGELQVADHRAVLAAAPGPAQVHAHNWSTASGRIR
jgi:hypothetical protein